MTQIYFIPTKEKFIVISTLQTHIFLVSPLEIHFKILYEVAQERLITTYMTKRLSI